MDLFVACDICGHRYVVPQTREGRSLKCKSCGVTFDVSRENEYDPDSTEFDEIEDDEDASDHRYAAIWNIARMVGHGLAGLITLAMLVWMCSLLHTSPREAAREVPGGTARRL